MQEVNNDYFVQKSIFVFCVMNGNGIRLFPIDFFAIHTLTFIEFSAERDVGKSSENHVVFLSINPLC